MGDLLKEIYLKTTISYTERGRENFYLIIR